MVQKVQKMYLPRNRAAASAPRCGGPSEDGGCQKAGCRAGQRLQSGRKQTGCVLHAQERSGFQDPGLGSRTFSLLTGGFPGQRLTS